ncbi:filaggrin member 2 [Trapelia coarctata]|nr:filaggrin member 2 [Trapelia coarctata]
MASNGIPRTQDPPLLQPSFKNRSHVSHKLAAKSDHSPHPLNLQDSRPRAGTPLLRIPTPLSSLANSFSRFGFDTKSSRAATPAPGIAAPIPKSTTPISKSTTPIPQSASTNHLEPFPDFEPPATSPRASLNSSRPPSSRAPSATPQRARKRKRDLTRKLFYPLLGILLLFLLALPITSVLLIQAAINGSFLVPYLIPLLLDIGFTIATGAGTATLWSKRRQRRKQKTRKDAIEIEKWKTLAREKSREVEIVGWAAERLRGGLRSLSRSRAASEGGKGIEAEVRARSKDGRLRQDIKARAKRSVSRGRTGRAKAREEVWTIDGRGMSDASSLQPKAKGSVARARAAVSAIEERQPRGKGSVARAREAVSAVKERREAALIEVCVTQQDKPSSIKSVATMIRRARADTDKPLPPLPLQPSGESLPPRGDSATVTSSTQRRRPSNPHLRELLQPSDSTDNGQAPSGFRPTIIDKDVLSEIQTQIVERSRSRAAKDRAKITWDKEPGRPARPPKVKKAKDKAVATEEEPWIPPSRPVQPADIMTQDFPEELDYELYKQRRRAKAAKEYAKQVEGKPDAIRNQDGPEHKDYELHKERRRLRAAKKKAKQSGSSDIRNQEGPEEDQYELQMERRRARAAKKHAKRVKENAPDDITNQEGPEEDDYELRKERRHSKAAKKHGKRAGRNKPQASLVTPEVERMIEEMRINNLRRMEAEMFRPPEPEIWRPSYSGSVFDMMDQGPFVLEFEDSEPESNGNGDNDEEKDDGGGEVEQVSHTPDDSPESPLEIMRGGHGGMGSSQSDDNFESSHALDNDAVSMTSSTREAKRAESLHKVAMWASRSELAIAGVSGESGNREKVGGETHDGSADSRGESTRGLQRDTSRSVPRSESTRGLQKDRSRSDPRSESARDLQRDKSRSIPRSESTRGLERNNSRSIHDIRQKFDEWVGEKRARSRGRAWTVTGR